jgi:hypothetical protein
MFTNSSQVENVLFTAGVPGGRTLAHDATPAFRPTADVIRQTT